MLNFRIILFFFLGALVFLIHWDWGAVVSIWWYVLLAVIFLIVLIVASFSMSWDFFLKSYTGNIKLRSKQVAITFDDGPHPDFTPLVLDILGRYNAKATFFCIGNRARANPDIVRAIHNNGHQLGNHSYSHKSKIDFSSKAEWVEQLGRTDNILSSITGKNIELFRPPFGVTTPSLGRAIKETGHTVVGWNIRPFDTVRKNKKAVSKFICRRIRPGSVVLLHDTHERIPGILEHLLLFLQQNGYVSVTVKELMNET